MKIKVAEICGKGFVPMKIMQRDFCALGESARTVLSSEGRRWTGIEAEFLLLRAGQYLIPGTSYHRLIVYFGRPAQIDCRCDGRRHSGIQSHGEMVFIPAGLDSSWDDPDSSFMRLRLDPSLLEQVSKNLECDTRKPHLRPRFKWHDARLEAIAWAIKAELESDPPSDRLYVESLSTALAVRLIAGPSGGAKADQGLSPSKRRQLIEFIECNLEQSLSLSDLAGMAGFSVSHFKTLFYRTFEMPVHQYVMRRRVERAKQLLISGLPLSQVALDTGFAHQSHLARCTRKMLGLTPGALARLQE